jgi:hypothetical protein
MRPEPVRRRQRGQKTERPTERPAGRHTSKLGIPARGGNRLGGLDRLTSAWAGYRVQSFIRMNRIFLITGIAPRGVTARLAGPGVIGNGRSGCYYRESEPYAETNKKEKSRPAVRNFGDSRSEPSNQGNPIHPDETLNSVTGPAAVPKNPCPQRRSVTPIGADQKHPPFLRSIRVNRLT